MMHRSFIIYKESGEKKDVTIRGVDKELYDQFIAHGKKFGLSAGDTFNNFLYYSIKQPWAMRGLRGKPPAPHGIIPEKISDLEKLTITKKDLITAGEKTMFLFRDIRELIFDEDVDGATLAKHVKLISHCGVKFLGDVPKLIQLGMVRKKREYRVPTDKDQLKDITIRNVSASLYDEFLAKAKSEGMTTGEYFSMILANIAPFFEIREAMMSMRDRELLVVIFEDHLTIKKMDLEALGERGVIFYGIKKLEFAQDIEQELFLKTIAKMIKCDEVILPKTVPRLIVLSRAINCKKTVLHN